MRTLSESEQILDRILNVEMRVIPAIKEQLEMFSHLELRRYAAVIDVKSGKTKAETIDHLITSGKATLCAHLAILGSCQRRVKAPSLEGALLDLQQKYPLGTHEYRICRVAGQYKVEVQTRVDARCVVQGYGFTLNEAYADALAKPKLPRIKDPYAGRCTECGDRNHKASNCDMEG